jgi:hypothetical protein
LQDFPTINLTEKEDALLLQTKDRVIVYYLPQIMSQIQPPQSIIEEDNLVI